MSPAQLTADHFASYRPEARQLAVASLPVLRRLPLAFLPLLLREVIAYDWKFPVERDELGRQLAFLQSLPAAEFDAWMAPFSRLQLSSELTALDWINSPAQFSEHLTTHLWATHQIDAFRAAATDYVAKLNAATAASPPAASRLTVVVVGDGAPVPSRPLFAKLRPHGTAFTALKPEDGVAILRAAVEERASTHPLPYAHWDVDGAAAASRDAVASVSYAALAPVRTALLNLIDRSMRSGEGPEALRTKLARTDATALGLATGAPVLDQFQVSLLTEGSGTQIYSTTFVQWAAREILRRAQPLTLLTRYAPRRLEQSLKDMLEAPHGTPPLDPERSLVDAEMGAYYTWINANRLPGAERSAFLVWFENHREAVAIAPSLPRGKQSDEPLDMPALLRRLA